MHQSSSPVYELTCMTNIFERYVCTLCVFVCVCVNYELVTKTIVEEKIAEL